MDISALNSLPLWQMTGGQFINLIKTAFGQSGERQPETVNRTDVSDGQRYAYGISGICEIFGCSKPTAQRLKRSGVIDGAIIQNGRTIVIDRQKALDLVQQDNEKRKGGRRCKK